VVFRGGGAEGLMRFLKNVSCHLKCHGGSQTPDAYDRG